MTQNWQIEGEIDTLVIGAGVVGIAIAMTLAQSGREVLLIEKQASFGREASSRNSEVIHAGLYPVPGSLKAKANRRGRDLLYQYLEKRDLPYRRCGKLIVACNRDQKRALVQLLERGHANGVDDLELLTAQALQSMVPELSPNCCGGIYSPSSGIVDSHQFMASMLADFDAAGGQKLFATELIAARACAEGQLCLLRAERDEALLCRHVINSAGRSAHDLALILGYPKAKLPPVSYLAGRYFDYAGELSYEGLIYPMPQEKGLGIHVTRDLGGAIRFGPDVAEDDSLEVPLDLREGFARAVQTYLPEVRSEHLSPAYAGIRTRRDLPDGGADFWLARDQNNSVTHLLGIESPGLTAALALAEMLLSAD